MEKIKTKITLAVLFAFLSINSVFAAAPAISSVKATDANNLKVAFTGGLDLSSGANGEVKVLQDVSIETATKSPTNKKEVSIVLK
jgi:hypothetical protein